MASKFESIVTHLPSQQTKFKSRMMQRKERETLTSGAKPSM